MVYDNGNGGSTTPLVNQDGSVQILTTIADANGKALPTRYLVVGDTLTQLIDFDTSTAYPVVADPTVWLGWKVYVKYSKSEVKALTSG